MGTKEQQQTTAPDLTDDMLASIVKSGTWVRIPKSTHRWKVLATGTADDGTPLAEIACYTREGAVKRQRKVPTSSLEIIEAKKPAAKTPKKEAAKGTSAPVPAKTSGSKGGSTGAARRKSTSKTGASESGTDK